MPQKKTSAQLDREIAEALSRSSAEQPFSGLRNLRIVPSERTGYAPGKYVLQYKDKNGMWFDIGDPKSKREAEAARKRESTRIVRTPRRSHAKKRAAKPRVAHVEAATPALYRWLRINARGATVTPEGFAVTDEAEWAQSLRAANAKEI
jgi:hypothetical protein